MPKKTSPCDAADRHWSDHRPATSGRTWKIIRRMVEANRLSSTILYGPPGIGKTSIASAIAGTTKYAFGPFNATVDSKKRLQEIAEEAKFSADWCSYLDEDSPFG